jgi:DNA-binding SARP family transcriptional activator
MAVGHTTRRLAAGQLKAGPHASGPRQGLRPLRALPAPRRDAARAPTVTLVLTRGFELRVDGRSVELPHSSERLLAFLALAARPLLRGYVAGVLWLESSEERALANLRSALWRLRRAGANVVIAAGDQLALASHVDVDFRALIAWAREAERAPEIEPDRLDQLLAARELLADWYDDWTIAERERFRNIRLHALEACCHRLAASGDHARAVEAGLAAVGEESLRESAQRALIAAYLAEGNAADALRQYASFRSLLWRELGVDPSPLLEAMVAPYRRAARAAGARWPVPRGPAEEARSS